MIFVRPSSNKSRTVFRSRALPSPSEIRPLKSTSVMPLYSRVVAKSEGIPFLRFLVRRARIRGAPVSIAVRTSQYRKSLGHDKLRAARFSRMHVKLVHKRLHQEDPPPRSAQQIFLRQRVG